MPKLPRSPRFPQLKLRALSEHPHIREVAERMRRLKVAEIETPPPAARQAAKAKTNQRKPGAGRRPSLGREDIVRLQQTYAVAIKDDARLGKHDAATAWLRPKLPEAARRISPRTIVRLIVKPVLDARTK